MGKGRRWIPACAGMTERGTGMKVVVEGMALTPALSQDGRGGMDSGFRRNDEGVVGMTIVVG